MAKKKITTKYGTSINVDGLTPEEIERVRSIAEDKGAYGAKGQALADTLRRKKKKAGETTPETPAPEEGPRDPAQADPEKEDPGTEGTGDTYAAADSFLEGLFKDFKQLDLSGAPKVLTDNDLLATRQGAYQSIYDTATKDLEKRKAQDLEAQKQELANRGIPFDPANPESLYGRTIGDVQNRYDTLYQDAMNQANLGADTRLQALVNANTAASDAFMNQAKSQYQSQIDAILASSNALQTLMEKYGIDEAKARQIIENKSREKMAKIAARGSGGGGGGGGGEDTGPIIGGTASGFGV